MKQWGLDAQTYAMVCTQGLEHWSAWRRGKTCTQTMSSTAQCLDRGKMALSLWASSSHFGEDECKLPNQKWSQQLRKHTIPGVDIEQEFFFMGQKKSKKENMQEQWWTTVTQAFESEVGTSRVLGQSKLHSELQASNWLHSHVLSPPTRALPSRTWRFFREQNAHVIL